MGEVHLRLLGPMELHVDGRDVPLGPGPAAYGAGRARRRRRPAGTDRHARRPGLGRRAARPGAHRPLQLRDPAAAGAARPGRGGPALRRVRARPRPGRRSTCIRLRLIRAARAGARLDLDAASQALALWRGPALADLAGDWVPAPGSGSPSGGSRPWTGRVRSWPPAAPPGDRPAARPGEASTHWSSRSPRCSSRRCTADGRDAEALDLYARVRGTSSRNSAPSPGPSCAAAPGRAAGAPPGPARRAPCRPTPARSPAARPSRQTAVPRARRRQRPGRARHRRHAGDRQDRPGRARGAPVPRRLPGRAGLRQPARSHRRPGPGRPRRRARHPAHRRRRGPAAAAGRHRGPVGAVAVPAGRPARAPGPGQRRGQRPGGAAAAGLARVPGAGDQPPLPRRPARRHRPGPARRARRRTRPSGCSAGWPAARPTGAGRRRWWRACGHLPLAVSLLARVLPRHRGWTVADLLHETRDRLLT